MKLKCNATGSKGNAYQLQASNGKVLLLECGINERTMLSNLSLNLVEGLFVSHNHSDHNTLTLSNKLPMSEKLKKHYGIPTYTCDDMEQNKNIDFGTFQVIPIELEHNVKCFGCLILSENLKFLFATDTKYIPTIKNAKIDYFLVECNFQESLLKQRIDELIESGNSDNFELMRLKRVYNCHCSLETLENYFKELGYKAKKIITLHNSNSGLTNEEDIIKTLQPYSEQEVCVCKKGNLFELC